MKYLYQWGTAVAQWLSCCVTNRKVTGSIPAGVIGNFLWHKILPIALWPWSRLSLEQKWVPGVFPGGKGGRYVRLTILQPSCAVVTKSGNLNFLEPSGPLRACNGTDLPLHLPFTYIRTADIYRNIASNNESLYIKTCNTVNLMFIGPCITMITEQ